MICNKIENCKEELSKSNYVLIDKKGGKSKFVLVNKTNSLFKSIDFERCVYKNKENDSKCDYGILYKKSIIYIELKGSDARKGFKQLLQTMNDTEDCFNSRQKKAIIVVSKFNKPNLAKKSKAYKDLIKKLGNTNKLIVKQNIYKEII